MIEKNAKKIQAASLGACFGVALGTVLNIVIESHILGAPALTFGLLIGAAIGYLLGEKLTKNFDN